MYVRRAAGLWICITCVLDVLVYGGRYVPTGPWQLAFKVVGGKWDSAAIGHTSFWQLFTSTDTYASSTAMQDKRDFMPSSDHYKSTIVEDWANKLISVQAVKLSFFKNNVEVAYIVFGGVDKTKSSVFFCDNILYSSYSDLDADNTLGQQCPGSSPMTGFPLTIMKDSYWHTVCPLTTAWTVIADANLIFSVCTSYAPSDGSLATPYFKYSSLDTVAGDLENNLDQADSVGIFFQVWDMVFKGIEAIKPANSQLNGLTGLYDSDTTENDNSNTTIRNLIHAQSSKIFKSDVVNRWSDYNIDAVKFSMLKSGSEKAYVVFDGINTNSTTWFDNGTLLYSSYGNNMMGTNLSVCSIQGDTYRNWQIQAESVEGDCSVWAQRGWLLVKEPRANGTCVWDNSRKKPYFLFSPYPEATSPSLFHYADVMAVFVHGWRLVFKVSAGSGLGEAASVLDLWLNHGSLNMTNQTTVNLISSPSPYRSHVVEQWETHYIYTVKLAAYRDGEEVFYAVFDATTIYSPTGWMDCDKLLYTSVPELCPNSGSGYTCNMSGDVFHFYIGKDPDCSNVSGSAVFAVVDTDSLCSSRSDLPQFLFSNALDTTLTENSIENLADTMAIFVAMENCYNGLCENGGTCQDIAGNYRCFCVPDFYGPTCAHLDGVWSVWTEWSVCSVTCGAGIIIRTRDCEGALGLGGCEGHGREELPCTLDPCPVDGGYTEWTDWSECTQTCGTGNQSRSRDCTNPAPQYGGADCVEESEGTQTCNEHPCPIDGGYTDLTEWSVCTQTCGTGNQTRSRDCTNPAPQHGGADCVGLSTEFEDCNTNPCPVDGKFTDWSVWSECTQTCGTGNQARSRDCSNPAPQHGGVDCVGDSEEAQTCNEHPCPIDGVYTAWTGWTTCTLTCGSGSRSRSRTCTDPSPQHGGADCQGDPEEDEDCNTNPCPVNGGLTEWTDWSDCTQTCGTGSSARYRDCTNPAPQYGGLDCVGDTTDTRTCNTDPCPVDGGYTEWTKWGDCTMSCGTGSQSRLRDCTNPAPQHGGTSCQEDSFQIQLCNTNPCPIHGAFSIWTDWDTCTHSCETGNQSRSRDCTNPAPQYGGLDCVGHTVETQECNNFPCPIDGGYTEWTDWTICTKSCGTGSQSRSRDCTNPTPQHGGVDCVGESEDTQTCNEHPCPIDGGYTDWTEWSLCTQTCGTGNQSRSRDCTNPAPQYSGANCVGESEESQTCNEHPCPIDGGYTDWTEWSLCTQKCGTGNQSRSRDCTNPAPQYGGAICVGEREQIQTCNEHPCPIDGGYTDWTDWNTCSQTCGTGNRSRSRDCTNPTPQHGGADCVGENEETQTCNEHPCPIGGGYTDWTEWSTCTQSCGTGNQSRSRDCTNPTPQHGGADCVGESEETQTCNEHSCPIDGGFTGWTEWSPCTQTCGTGNQSRSRDCTNPIPQHGGVDCVGENEETKTCNEHPCPIDGGFIDWELWSVCTLTCGSGSRTRSRACDSPPPQYGGQDCAGASTETDSCNTNPCPIDGGYTEWTEWTVCTKSCGTGNQSRSHDCTNPAPQHGGTDCVGDDVQYQNCNTEPCPIDGGFTLWSPWTDCTVTCGSGGRSQVRTCTNPVPQYGGLDCAGDSFEIQDCNTHPCPIDGGYSGWTEWTVCTLTCGTGNQSRSRDCTNPTPQHDGADCVGEAIESQDCNTQPCPIDGGYTDWSVWTVCTLTCGTGNQSRSRDCTNPTPQHGGADCVGASEETQTCNEHPCPIDGGYTDWSVWTVCTLTCGTGNQSRSRDCTNPVPQHGGANCVGESEEIQTCNEHPCPIDGGYTDWTAWGPCSKTCETGDQTRSRDCTNPAPQHGGADCVGIAVDIQACDEGPCPIDGGYTPWTVWGGCTLTCGGGTYTRSRDCTNPAPQYGGAECEGQPLDTSNCNVQPCPIDGEFSSWTAWSVCTAFCGPGIQLRSRSCSNPPPQYGGADCMGDLVQAQTCQLVPCPIDGGWSYWSDWGSCSKSCASGSQTRARTCSMPSPQYGGDFCVGDDMQTQACNNIACPVDGVWSDWLPWSQCTVTCGGGSYERMRVCEGPFDGGAPCTGATKQTGDCNTHNCPPEDGIWLLWSDWSSCSVTCRNGVKTRGRNCSLPSYGGLDCQGDALETETCEMDDCPVDGVWLEWSIWTMCTESCGGGIKGRTRICSEPEHGGMQCPGHPSEITVCNQHDCPPVDGGWTVWSEWTQCSRTCGTGDQTRSRSCTDPEPEWEGEDCHGSTIESLPCNVFECPVDGVWSEWTDWSQCTNMTNNRCTEACLCGRGQRSRLRLCNSPAPNQNGQPCKGHSNELKACNNPCADFQCDPVNNPQFCMVKRHSSHGTGPYLSVIIPATTTVWSVFLTRVLT